MPEAFSRKTLLDLAAAFFLLGSILVLVISILSVPIETVYLHESFITTSFRYRRR